jgi:hypothetical protein
MENLNAFIGKTTRPTPEELAAVLGRTSTLWAQLVDALTSELPITEQEWNSYSPKYGWALILKVKKRRIVYLSPFAGCFQASLILGDKAMAAARAGNLAKPILKILDEAPHYPEGTGIRLMVKSAKDLPAVRKLAQIKQAN